MGAVTIVGFNFANQPAPPKFVSNIPAPTEPLSKPEPSQLLSQAGLNLTAAQRSEIAKIDAEWKAERSRLVSAMQAVEPKQGDIDEVATGLANYSELSRTFNAARSVHYQRAQRVLTETQRTKVTR